MIEAQRQDAIQRGDSMAIILPPTEMSPPGYGGGNEQQTQNPNAPPRLTDAGCQKSRVPDLSVISIDTRAFRRGGPACACREKIHWLTKVAPDIFTCLSS